MADVRLTATNPEDSSVVPVACDASGRLLLEEQGVGPQGPQGPPGPKGEDGQDGDPFSGNFAGDVTFGGSAEFADNVSSYYFEANEPNPAGLGSASFLGKLNGVETSRILANGSATFAGDVRCAVLTSESSLTNTWFRTNNELSAKSYIWAAKNQDTNTWNAGMAKDGKLVLGNLGVPRGVKITLDGVNGSVTFADGKAGFTAEGYLWCTTRRGDTVILDATSNGLANWMDYTPTSRIDEVRDKLDAIRGETGEMPADTP